MHFLSSDVIVQIGTVCPQLVNLPNLSMLKIYITDEMDSLHQLTDIYIINMIPANITGEFINWLNCITKLFTADRITFKKQD